MCTNQRVIFYFLFINFICLTFIFTNAYSDQRFIHYNGYLESSNGSPIDKTLKIKFEIMDSNGVQKWERIRFVTISNGCMNVKLGKKNLLKHEFFDGNHFIALSEVIDKESKILSAKDKVSTNGYAWINNEVVEVCKCSYVSDGTESISSENDSDDYDLKNTYTTLTPKFSLKKPLFDSTNFAGTEFIDNYIANSNGSNLFSIIKFKGVGTNSNQIHDHYGIYQEQGGWTHPYPDLVINYHTGLKLVGYYKYGGIRFYSGYSKNGSPTTEAFSVGNGDHDTRVNYNLRVKGQSIFSQVNFNGVGGNSNQPHTHYGIYQEPGGWSHPYPDLVLNYHTGIKYVGYYKYGGHRFYSGYKQDGTPTTEAFSVGNGDHDTRVNYNLRVKGQSIFSQVNFNGVSGNSNQPHTHYGIYQEAGAWSHPYPDLIINYHTGIKYVGYYKYGGHRFYSGYSNDGTPTTEAFSIGNGNHDTRVNYNLHVKQNVDIEGNVSIGTKDITQYKLYVAGTAYSTDGWTTSSDIKWKKNIKPLQNSLEKVTNLNGVSFNWRTDEYTEKMFSEDKQIGFIAQDVEKVFPELVSTDDDGNKSVYYDKMTAVLLESVKELKAQNDALKKRLTYLEQKLLEE